MLRFVGDAAVPLATHLFRIDINLDGFAVIARQLLPDSPSDPSLLRNIQLFSFPDPTSIESNSFFTFVIGDTACDFHMGFVSFTSTLTARAILSDFYYPDLFKSLLSLPDDQLISQFRSLLLPVARAAISLNSRVFPLDGSRERQSLLHSIFKTFCGFDIAKIVIGMLQARHIYVISSSASTVSRFVAGLPLLIEPFRWDMNCIPVLPIALKEAAQVPVPTLIGLTQAEVLLEGRVDARVIVNADLRMVIDKPPLDLSYIGRVRAIQQQMEFHRNVNMTLGSFGGCPGFPHKHVQRLIRGFLFQYLKIFTGEVGGGAQKFREALAAGVPEYLESSQVLHDLLKLEEAPPAVRRGIEDWLGEVFKTKSGRPAKSRGQGKPIPQSVSLEPIGEVKRQNDISLIDFATGPQGGGGGGAAKVTGASQTLDLIEFFEGTGPQPVVAPAASVQTDIFDIFADTTQRPWAGVRAPHKSSSEPTLDALIDFT